jgi:hypothetical protein
MEEKDGNAVTGVMQPRKPRNINCPKKLGGEGKLSPLERQEGT